MHKYNRRLINDKSYIGLVRPMNLSLISLLGEHDCRRAPENASVNNTGLTISYGFKLFKRSAWKVVLDWWAAKKDPIIVLTTCCSEKKNRKQIE